MKPLAVIRNEAMCPLGIVEGVLDEARAAWRYVDVWNGDPIPDAAEISGLVVLGGTMNADETAAYPYLADVRALMRETTEAGSPVLGVCLGAQLLARAFDAQVHHQVAREISFCKVTTTAAGAHDELTAPFSPASLVFQWHEDHCELPSGAELLVTSETVPVEAFRIGRAYGVQFHFEVTTQIVNAWLDHQKPGALEDDWGMTHAEMLADVAVHLEAQQGAGRAAAAAFVAQLG